MKGLFLLLPALILRLLPAPAVFRGGRVLFVDVDDYYHMRRILTAAANFPRLPGFDWYLGYPRGFECFWPPLHDWLLAAAALVVGHPWHIAALAPPLLGILTLALFYRSGVRDFGRGIGSLALLLAAFAPMLIQYSMVGRPDHHCVENLWFLAALQVWRSNPAAAGLLMALGLQSWIGSIVFSLILFAVLLWEKPFKGAHRLFFAQVPVLLALTCANHWVSAGSFAFDAPSLFQPALLAALGCFVRGGRAIWAGAVLIAVAAFGSVESFALFSGALPRIFAVVPEMRPYWTAWGKADLPLLLAAVGVAGRKEKLWLCWLAATGLMALGQTRYAMHFSLPAALFSALGIRRLWPEKPWPRIAFAAALLWVYSPILKNAAALWLARDSATIDPGLVQACDWLRQNSPPTRSLWKDEGKPEYGVYADAAVGGVVAAVAERPASAAMMHPLREQIVDSTLFYFMTDEARARRFLAERGMRYLLLHDIGPLYSTYASLYGVAGVDPARTVYARLVIGDKPVAGFRKVYDAAGTKIFAVAERASRWDGAGARR